MLPTSDRCWILPPGLGVCRSLAEGRHHALTEAPQGRWIVKTSQDHVLHTGARQSLVIRNGPAGVGAQNEIAADRGREGLLPSRDAIPEFKQAAKARCAAPTRMDVR